MNSQQLEVNAGGEAARQVNDTSSPRPLVPVPWLYGALSPPRLPVRRTPTWQHAQTYFGRPTAAAGGPAARRDS